MAISGIGSQTITQFPQRTVPATEKSLRKEPETPLASSNNSVKSTELTTTLFKSVPTTTSTNQPVPSKSELSNIETNRRRFQLQSESQKPSTKTGKALQSFADVASFEKKDELSSVLGIDIFI